MFLGQQSLFFCVENTLFSTKGSFEIEKSVGTALIFCRTQAGPVVKMRAFVVSELSAGPPQTPTPHMAVGLLV